MGDWFETIADVEATAEEADRLGVEVLSWLVEQGIVMAQQTDCIARQMKVTPTHSGQPR